MPRPTNAPVAVLHCPDCGGHTLELIETTEPDGGDEYKEIRTCPICDNLVYIVRYA